MTKDDVQMVVTETLRLAKDHWVRTGTAVPLEDSPKVATDVIMALGLIGLLGGDSGGNAT